MSSPAMHSYASDMSLWSGLPAAYASHTQPQLFIDNNCVKAGTPHSSPTFL